MKCPCCQHDILDNKPNFCSQCGLRLSEAPSGSQKSENEPKPLIANQETDGSKSQKNEEPTDNKDSNKSPKRPSEEQPNPKKKKKKRKKSKKKKDDSVPSDQDLSQSDLSHISLEESQGKITQEKADSSDGESSDSTIEKSLEEDPSSLKKNSTSLLANTTTASSENTNSEKPASMAEGTEASQPTKTTVNVNREPDVNKSNQDQTPEKAADNDLAAAEVKAADPKQQKDGPKSSKKEDKSVFMKESNLDQNVKLDPNRTDETQQKAKSQGGQKTNGKVQQEHKQGKNSAQSKPNDSGSSVDPEGMDCEETGNKQEMASDAHKQKRKDTKESTKTNSPAAPPPKTHIQNKNITTRDRLTIYFHAVLSKDFKFDPEEDRIFIRAGKPIAESWNHNVAELEVTRDLGKHGFLVEGRLETRKAKTVSESIAYKYVVYNMKKEQYEYEFIYKHDSSHEHTNRCLFVKDHLITDDGDWHQYDDIICAEPSKGVLKRLKEALWPEQRKSLIEGREIAANIMLESIFDILMTWSEINLKSFQMQLNQFFQVYANPFVFEDRQKKWYSLQFGEEDVRRILKEFMLLNVIPQLRDGDRESPYVQDPMKAAVIMLHVWRSYGVKLENPELHRLCNALCLPKLEKEDFLQYWSDFSQDVSTIKSLPQMLVDLIKVVRRVTMPRWIMVLPLLHLLKGTIKPFQLKTSANLKYGLQWAGLEGLDIGNQIYINSQERKALINVIKNNSHLMKVDPLLIRSFLYLMPLDEQLECSDLNPELLDMLHVFTNKIPQEITAGGSSQAVIQILAHIQERLIEEKYSCFTHIYRKECLTAAIRLLEKVCRGVRPESHTQNFPEIPVAAMNLVASVFDFFLSNKQESQDEDREHQNAKDLVISQGMGIMRDWMNQSFKQSLLSGGYVTTYKAKPAELETWNNIISINFKDQECSEKWRQTLTMDFEGKFKRETALSQTEFYCSKIEELSASHPHVAASIEKCALEAVTSLCQTRSEGRLFERLNINWKFGKLISAIIEKSWPRDGHGKYHEKEEVVLQHLLSWTAAKDIFRLYGADKKVIEKLSQDARDRLAIAISAFGSINNQLIQGDIKISLLKIILERKTDFLELLKIDCLSEKEQHRDLSKMRRFLQHREEEVKAVYHEKELVDVILTMSHKLEEHMTVDISDLEEKSQVNIEMMPLNNFMEVHHFDQLADIMSGIVTFFSLEEEIRQMAEVLCTFNDSIVFRGCWERFAIQMANEEMEEDRRGEGQIVDIRATLEMIYEDIYIYCIDEYKDIYSRLKNGSIRLEEVDQIFKAYKDKYDDLTQELNTMCELDKPANRQWIHNRVEQVQQYHELHLAVASAQVIMSVKDTLGLHGDFRVLETLTNIIQADFQKEPLNRIDNDLMQAKMVLVDITEPRRLCLHELVLRRHFVRWVKDALEDINELKVFVDLASISAGENDMDVDRVACFHDAILGYSSVLYELKPDSGFHALKEVLNKLWRALENDNNLPKKLRDSARHIEWLKTVKDSHGSVELSSLSLASAINNKGIYLISAQGVTKLSLETALKLQIPEEHDEGRQMRCYSLEDLRELQNKLMLMSGKGDQGQNEVEHFVEVFASVQRLTEAFIALYTAGNPLFRHWEVQINCSSKDFEPCILMDFNLRRALSVTVEGKTDEHLPELCRKMEKCLEYWMNFVHKQRSQHYFLNYYTAEQIVYLCSKLTQQNVNVFEDQVLMMLSFIKPNCTLKDLRQVWHKLQYEIITKQDKNEDIEFQTFVLVSASDLEEFPSEMDSFPSLVEKATGVQAFDHIWNAYMKDMKNFLPNILDIKSLGRFLEILANKEDDSEEDDSEEDISDDSIGNVINREMPRGLVTGKPNLIVCPHDDALTSCISIYMSSKNEVLPSYDEVLLCNPSTPYEQVELFLRRCLGTGYRGRKIYSLVYGDLLSYDVSSKVESFFQLMKMQSSADYRLVIICSSEREHAYLPSAFSQYRLHMIPQEPLAMIQQYLHKHYTVPAEQSSAAAAFKDRLCVGLVSSQRAGVGKSLYIRRLYEKLKHSTKKQSTLKCICLIEPKVDETTILQSLLDTPKTKELVIFHFDVTSSVQKGLQEFLFKLLILRYLMDSEGKMWRCNDKQLYVIEILEPTVKSARNDTREAQMANHTFMDVFPNIFCRPPKEVLMLEMRMQEDPTIVSSDDPLMDDQEFRSEAFQRPYQYLTRFHNHIDLDVFTYHGVEGSHVNCLQMLLMYCGVMDPSWAELRNFTWFLNLQLRDCETSVFCDATFTGDTLRGFKTFVVDFMILMAKDFATPSLSISDQSPGRSQVNLADVREEDLAPFLIRKRWETEPHPYIFFNDDHNSMTFIGFHLQPNDQNYVDAIEPTSRRVIKKDVMTRELYEGLQLQRVPFNIDFDSLPRWEKIERVCNVLGIQWPLDPDETYELTTDNILKMLAIHMRFRCGIPVIVMGETGCGKTRLIKFLCELRRSGVATENMKLVKVHGGTTSEMIYSKVKEAEVIASINKQDYGFDSVLFFDEANTTEAISSIKEVLCDKTVKGEHLTPHSGLQIIAACNPYRKHTDDMIQRLESAGLGYRVRAEETDEKLGSIPLRQLVYRVQALPPSMIPLVWDFGQLNDQTEKTYIQQIVQRVTSSKEIQQDYIQCITNVLSASQKYMRNRKDECSFVSLRDVERCMQAFVWFHDHHKMFFSELQKFKSNQNDEGNEGHHQQPEVKDPVLWSLVMAIGVCYHACLEDKDKYRQKISSQLPTYTPARVMQEISLMQDLLLSGVPMGDTIARNSALKENVFMMVLCIELRIPLFLVGKPGSSKSLSKTLVADAMQGQAAHSDLYKMLKQIHLVSFQCSPHSTPEGIINTFRQCGRFQEGKNLNEYISVVVLDEIGLAEDSPKMPLKTLHPLLEEGCIDDEPLPHKKVGFIGISNWALDPAKMNRGIFVSRGDPDEKELIESAKGICSSDFMVLERVRDFFKPFARSYLNICRKQGKGFFGLRDYYSLIKMIFAVASQRKPTPDEIVKAVLRNFSGKDDVDAVSVFSKRLNIAPNLENINTIEFVKANIQAVGQEEECRYLLVLTKNYAALSILQQTFFSESGQPEILFGSSFPKDQEYTQICRNINRVKICMETGQTVVLLNLQNLYESLYDALNQYYVCLGGQKYVDLGLGTHRVKCRVHKDFRLIVIEEREVVYKQFPIPLINRLEKHYLDIHTVLKAEQKKMVEELEKWAKLFTSLSDQHAGAVVPYKYTLPDVFIGYHSDTCASVILKVIEEQKNDLETSDSQSRLLDEAKLILLKCATPDSVVRLDCTHLPKVESQHMAKVYFEEQSNSCLAEYIHHHTRQETKSSTLFTEVTTFSRLLTAFDMEPLEKMFHSVELLSLQQFDTEHSFLKKIRNFLTHDSPRAEHGGTGARNRILIIQCNFDEPSKSTNLIASAKYSSLNEINKITHEITGSKVFVYFITRLPRMEGGTSYIGFHGGPWKSVHIDDLRRSKDIVSDIKTLQNMKISQMFETKEAQLEAMETDDMYTESEHQELEESGLDNVVDTTALLRSCVQTAVGMLRDQVTTGFRSTQRVEILLTLLNDKDDKDEIKDEFLQTIKKRLHSLLLIHDGNTFIKSNWVLKEASNIDALQEGGTFRHTLWKRVQAVVVPMFAHLISVIDRDQNMDLLLNKNCSESVKRLWLDIFSNQKLLEISHLTMDPSSETRTILVQNYMAQDKNIGCIMPFSWRIRDYLEELCIHSIQNEGHTHLKLVELFWKTPVGLYIEKADSQTQMDFYHRYLQDFISMSMNVTSAEDLQLLCGALNSCVTELRIQLNDSEKGTALPWVHAAYHKFKNRLQNLSRMMCIEPQVTNDLLGNPHAGDHDELVLDIYAAFACLEHLEPRMLNSDAQRQAWLRQVKKLQVPIELICSEDSVRQYGERSKTIVNRVQSGWNRIFSLSLFVEHMLLGIEQLDQKLTPLVLESTQRLGKILERNSDIKTQQIFEAVIGLLKSCKDGVVERIFRFGDILCPICMGDPQDPLCLSCKHIYCVACIKKWLIPGQMFCPLCIEPVQEDYPLVPSNEIRILVNQHAAFRKRCNAFFIDLVSTVCFKDNSPPCSAVILHLLSFLMVRAGPVPIIRKTPQMLTKVLSPFDDSVDKNPIIRSVVLKLLMKYSFDEVKEYLQQHLVAVEQSNILEETDKTELYCLYINCLEDSMFERLQFRCAADKKAYLANESAFLTEYLQTRQCTEKPTMEFLQQVARVRMDLDMTANLIIEKLRAAGSSEVGQNETMAFLDSVINLCRRSGNDWYRVYLIRKICRQHGVEFVQKIQRKAQMGWLFPDEVHTQDEETPPVDLYLVYGEDYKTIREGVAKIVMEGKVEGLDVACEGCKSPLQLKAVYVLLALFREITTLYAKPNEGFHPKPQQLEALEAYIQKSSILTSAELKAFARGLVTNTMGPLSVRPGMSAAHSVAVELSVHLAAVLLCGNQGILAPLQQLALTPANMQAAFLPSMPEDMVAVAQQALGGLHWYRCPNGHPCTIGECGQPMQTSRCVDCGAMIGGNNHAPLQGFHRLQIEGDRTQTGHILGDPSRRDNPDMLDTKNISPVPFNVVRMLTHLAMLLGACEQTQFISAIIKPPVREPATFLLAHLRKDIEHLIRSLGKGTDDTITAVHLVISSLLSPHQQQKWPVPYDILLSNKEARNGWELEMSNAVITPLLKHLDRQLKEVNNFIRADSRISANPIMKLVFGDPQLFLASLPANSPLHCSAVWSCREKVSILSLSHIVEQNDGKDTVPVLWRFLHKEAELRLVKNLPDILTLQKDLVKNFQNVSELTYETIGEFLQTQKAATLKAWYEKYINIFLTTWNQLRVSLATNGEIKIPNEFCQGDLDLNSSFKVLLPQRQGAGLCSTALISYLIALHNDIIYCMDKHTGEETSYKVSPADLTDLHVIRYELERDLMPLVLSNTQYSIEKGQETLYEYDLPKIQQQIISHFLLGKPLITLNGIPTLVNRHDRNYEIIIRDIKAKVKQEPLQTLTLFSVAGELHSYSEVCEALSTLEVALGFLAMTGGEPHMQLSCYLEEVLQMGSQMAQHIVKAFSMCYLKHCVALWQLLASLKSENMLRLKRDPFVGVSKKYKQPLGEEEHRLLTAFFSKNSADVFLLEMHEFLVLVLRKNNDPDAYRPDWGLKDTLLPYMERKDMDVPPDVEEHFPEEICLSHYVEAWKFIIAFKQERGQRH